MKGRYFLPLTRYVCIGISFSSHCALHIGNCLPLHVLKARCWPVPGTEPTVPVCFTSDSYLSPKVEFVNARINVHFMGSL